MKRIFFGFILGVIAVFGGGYLFLISGLMPVATIAPALPLEEWAAHLAIHAAMRGETSLASPLKTSDENLHAGAQVYLQHCAVCHGQPDHKPSMIARGMFPKPPQLFEKDDLVTDDPIAKIYWKVKNGIRLTGMPGFQGNLSETEMWQVSQVLLEADHLPEPIKSLLSATAPGN